MATFLVIDQKVFLLVQVSPGINANVSWDKSLINSFEEQPP